VHKRTVVIVGAGALGSHLVLLARNWPAELTVVDFDRTERKNTLAQFHNIQSVGNNKAKALQQAMLSLFRKKTDAHAVKVTAGNIEVLLGTAFLVIDCTDNYEAREVIQKFCKKTRPCLHGCLSAAGDLARIIWTEHFKADKEGEDGQATCVDGQNLWFHAMAASLLAGVAQRFLETEEKQSFQLTPTSLIRLT